MTMDLPAEVLIHSTLLGMKGKEGTLLQIHEGGYYEVTCRFGERTHRLLLPIADTALIAQAEEDLREAPVGAEIER